MVVENGFLSISLLTIQSLTCVMTVVTRETPVVFVGARVVEDSGREGVSSGPGKVHGRCPTGAVLLSSLPEAETSFVSGQRFSNLSGLGTPHGGGDRPCECRSLGPARPQPVASREGGPGICLSERSQKMHRLRPSVRGVVLAQVFCGRLPDVLGAMLDSKYCIMA